MKLKATYQLIAILVFLCCCDPAKIILIKTQNSSNSQVTFYGNGIFNRDKYVSEDTLGITHYSPFFEKREDDKKTLFFGLGGWSDQDISRLAHELDSIEIVNSDNSRRIIYQNQIEEFLRDNRRGIANHVIKIEAD